MSPKQESILNMVVNAIIGALATLFILFGTGAWSSKESSMDHDKDISRIESKLDRNDSKLDRVLDALCGDASRQHVCQGSVP